MAQHGSLLQYDWLESRDGKDLIASILRRDRRRIFGLIESPNLLHNPNIQQVSYKIFLLGKSGVGKTSLVSKLVGREIPSVHKETPGIQMSVVYWPAKVLQTQQIIMFKLVFWDAGEQCLKKFDHILPACKQDADAVIFTFSLANRGTWEDLPALISRSEVTDSILEIAVGTKADQNDATDGMRKAIRDFEKVWKIPVLKTANINGPLLPDGKSLDGRKSIEEVAPFLNRLVSLLWEHDQIATGSPADAIAQRTNRDIPISSTPEKQKRKSVSSAKMSIDDEYDDRSSNNSSTSSSRKSTGEKLTVTYC